MDNLHNQTIGKLGEDIASGYLQDKGLTIIQRNFKARYGEIDIIAHDNTGTYVFVEVKTRLGDDYGDPELAVHKFKLQEVIKTAEFYLASKRIDVNFRIDVVAVNLKSNQGVREIEWFENVTNS